MLLPRISLRKNKTLHREPVGKGAGKREFSRPFQWDPTRGISLVARSAVRRPIARSIFLPTFLPALWLLALFCFPITLSAQVTTDHSRPFGLGEVVLLPGTTAYLGDLPHEIENQEDVPYHTIGGLLA